ncbi:hypothetical protein NDU88_007038 [Pleurodeles waltl]|uniref:Uncharacterized protein n=1 Tax=Pleurodeles waltl TaxID=8319 RepID=A0AAV7LS63_PLEWA|nr:hypothetical protein NDU88_007038 [Pleurodeles waltl]
MGYHKGASVWVTTKELVQRLPQRRLCRGYRKGACAEVTAKALVQRRQCRGYRKGASAEVTAKALVQRCAHCRSASRSRASPRAPLKPTPDPPGRAGTTTSLPADPGTRHKTVIKRLTSASG